MLTVVFDKLALSLGDVVDPACMDLMSSTEQTLPASHRVGANDRAVNAHVRVIVTESRHNFLTAKR
jgi:hypothetical protein